MVNRWSRGSVVSQLTLIPAQAHNRECLASSTPTKDEGGRMKAEDSQQTISRELQLKDRQVRLVYKRWNFALKVPFRPTFGGARRAFQAAILTRHVVAAA